MRAATRVRPTETDLAGSSCPTMPDDDLIASILLDLARRRGPDRTFCPSEAARRLSDEWRPLMGAVRRVAARLRDEGRLTATQRGGAVDPLSATGPIRLGLPPR